MARAFVSELVASVQSSNVKDGAFYIFSAWLAYWISVFLYRISPSHPLSKIPGPKYEFYYDIYPHRYQYLWRIKALHEQYGPIIRINPIHVHIHNATFFDAIYAGGTHKRDRCAWWMHAGSKSFAGSILETLEHDKHKARRAAISVFFSKRSIQLLEPRIKHIVQLLVNRLKAEKGEVVNPNCAMAAVSMDVISEYCFGESMNSMKRKEYGKEWLEIAHDGISMRHLGRQFPWLVNFMIDLPPTIAAKLSPVAEKTIAFNSKLLRKIEWIMRGEDKEWDSKRKRTVFHEIRDGSLPEKEKHPFRLMGEASILLGAGTETTARTLSVTAYYIIKHDRIRRKLRQELKSVMPTKQSSVSLPMFETLPFLTAVIHEGLRTAHVVSSRHPRIAHSPLVYGPYTIPPGTPVAQSLYLLHTDPTIFPDPFAFRPERWIENPRLTKNLFAFSRGSQNCVGMNLATAELFIGIAMISREVEIELYDTSEERDVLVSNDCFIEMADLKSEGVKVRIIGEVEE